MRTTATEPLKICCHVIVTQCALVSTLQCALVSTHMCPRFNFADASVKNVKTDTIWQPTLQRQLGVTSGDSKGVWVGHAPHIFLLGPLLPPPVFS